MATKRKTIRIADPDWTPKCGNCEHFSAEDGMTVCMRYPRTFVYYEDEVSLVYPPHGENDRCGEFKRRTNA